MARETLLEKAVWGLGKAWRFMERGVLSMSENQGFLQSRLIRTLDDMFQYPDSEGETP